MEPTLPDIGPHTNFEFEAGKVLLQFVAKNVTRILGIRKDDGLADHCGTAAMCQFEGRQAFVTANHVLTEIEKSGNYRAVGVSAARSGFQAQYLRFSAVRATSNEKRALHAFIEKHLAIAIRDDMVGPTTNETRIRIFIGRTTGAIAGDIYDVIRQEADRLGLFTYEVRNPSKASKIFLSREYDFTTEDVLWRELLIFLVHSQPAGGHVGLLRSMEPLPFEPGLETEYLQCFASTEKMLWVVDELEEMYEGLDNQGERLKAISAIGDPLVFFGDDEDQGAGQEDSADLD